MATTSMSKKVLVGDLPKWLKAALKGMEIRKRYCYLRVLEGDVVVRAYNVRWDGGTRNYYASCRIGGDSWNGVVVEEDHALTPAEGFVLVEHGFFCGPEITPTVYVREDDMAAFCGGRCPLQGAPAGAVADWLVENDQQAAASLVADYFC